MHAWRAVLLAASCWCAGPAHATPPLELDAASLLPANTVVLVDIPSVPKLRADLGRTELGRVFDHPALRPILASAQVNWHGSLLGVEFERLAAAVSGQAVFAIEWSALNRAPRWIAILTPGERRAALEFELGRVLQTLDKQGAWRGEVERGGVRVVTRTWTSAAKDGPRTQLACAWKNDTLIVADDPELIDVVLMRWPGKIQPAQASDDRPLWLAENRRYRAAVESCRAQAKVLATTKPELASALARPALRWHVRPLHLAFLLGSDVARQGLNEEQREVVLRFAKAGFGLIDGVSGWHYFAVSREIQSLAHLAIPHEGLLNAARVLAVAHNAQAIAPPGWLPPEAMCVTAEVDLPLLFETYCELEDARQGFERGETLAFWRDAEKEAGVSVALDVLQPLGKRATMAWLPPARLGDAPRVVYAIDVVQPRVVLATMAKEYGIQKSSVLREVHGATLYELHPRPRLNRVGSRVPAHEPLAPPPGIALAGNLLIYASDVPLLEAVLARWRAQAKPAPSSARVMAALRNVSEAAPSAVHVVGPVAPAVEGAYEHARRGGLFLDPSVLGVALRTALVQDRPLDPAWQQLPVLQQLAPQGLGEFGWKVTATRTGWEATAVVLSSQPAAPSPPDGATPPTQVRCCPPCAPRPRLWQRLLTRLRCR